RRPATPTLGGERPDSLSRYGVRPPRRSRSPGRPADTRGYASRPSAGGLLHELYDERLADILRLHDAARRSAAHVHHERHTRPCNGDVVCLDRTGRHDHVLLRPDPSAGASTSVTVCWNAPAPRLLCSV